MEDLWENVKKLLKNKCFANYSKSYDRCPLIKLANQMNGPRMRLIHWSILAEIQRIPHSKENLAVDALEAIDKYGAGICEIFMVSHRWLRPRLNSSESHPDSIDNQKAKAINEFTKWRQEWVELKHGFVPEIFYWIDFCCIDQYDLASAIPLLPIWVACCERFLRIETSDYSERAWCRLEPLLSYVFQFADHHTIIHLDFKYSSTNFQYGKEKQVLILDPLEGKSTDEADLAKIKPIVDLTKTIQIKNDREKVDFGLTTIKCFQL
ncbi:unnamed protein product [Rotaria sp. Silwood2]|nr:unnamed protein product [Rotaria sp. Silwood2]CAF3150287.1 unnamed protein product [Rotaria sp. Silwood2]CAF3227759.1 unnamed protein product [Rotaria sp. Silwood2]CAF4023979.1 unnamed protein product [Rotaria sp. Silwood2]CAF4372786.1 unnamed protein product [Rotaria sp. Silwood2]